MPEQPSDDRGRLLPTPEEAARIDAILNDPDRTPPEVEWRDPGPDPFGRDWEWMHGPESNDLRGLDRDDHGEEDEPSNRGATIPFAPSREAVPRRSRFLWAASAAASLLVIMLGTWAFVPRGRGPIREHDVTAWVTQRLESGGGGIRITAPAGGDEEAETPVLKGLDRPQDAVAPSAPHVYAPIRIQEQLVVPEISPSAVPGETARRPVRSVTESVRPGELFYLEFTTASTPSPGSAVVVTSRDGSSRLLSDEMAVSPADRTGYFGPLKMDDVGASYFVILADRTSTPLLSTVSRALAKGDGGLLSPESLRERMSTALEDSGHTWYGIQRIEIRPESKKEPAPQGKP